MSALIDAQTRKLRAQLLGPRNAWSNMIRVPPADTATLAPLRSESGTSTTMEPFATGVTEELLVCSTNRARMARALTSDMTRNRRSPGPTRPQRPARPSFEPQKRPQIGAYSLGTGNRRFVESGQLEPDRIVLRVPWKKPPSRRRREIIVPQSAAPRTLARSALRRAPRLLRRLRAAAVGLMRSLLAPSLSSRLLCANNAAFAR